LNAILGISREANDGVVNAFRAKVGALEETFGGLISGELGVGFTQR
jgi:hypothetical protein